MKKTVLEKINSELTYFDGGMGTLLQQAGLSLGELPERWNLTHPEVVKQIHTDYLAAGADIVKTNTFGANALKFSDSELEEIILAGMRLAKEAVEKAGRGYIALDIGPCGKLLKPYGDLEFEQAVALFAKTVKIGAPHADCVLIETMNDAYETKAAVLAVKENCNLPVFVTNVYGADGKLMTGADPKAMIALLEGLRVDALGLNCSLGIEQMLPLLPTFYQYSSLPIIVNPNAGLPKEEDGKTYYDADEERFSTLMQEAVKAGARVIGGCCGTTPKFIEKTVQKTKNVAPMPVTNKNYTLISSYTHAVEFSQKTVLIGERINPTGKKRFKQALRENDVNYVLQEGIRQQDSGAAVLDVNVGLPEIDEVALLQEITVRLQGVCNLPLQLDTTNPTALENALRLYNGKAMINSVNGKAESMHAVFPLAKKYGGLTVALTLDENGIPDTAEGRLAVAQRIYQCAKSYGIDKKDLIFDPLAMSVSSDPGAALVTLQSLKLLQNNGFRTVLGVSNVSFGLPKREAVNATFFSLAMQSGLNAAIVNVDSTEMLKAYHAFNALCNLDENCGEYIRFATEKLTAESPQVLENTAKKAENTSMEGGSPLQQAIVKGLKEQAKTLTEGLLTEQEPLKIIDGQIIPALDEVGKGFEEKRVFLPQLLMSAEAAKWAFEAIKTHLLSSGQTQKKRSVFVLATVKGDIHDIGKNIVRVLLENYGFDVVDLGKDVAPEKVVQAVLDKRAPLVGLSALMTTTVPSMAETVQLLKEQAPWCKIVVGGAVMTQEYADKIGADKYAKDAMETVRYAEGVEKTLSERKEK
ncbi:MAG: homocysteine S-methyltransferase family protein [Clostridia bacterium]|nr:homocysteine S-methyltransferase family protein [Clostridia bacterium]